VSRAYRGLNIGTPSTGFLDSSSEKAIVTAGR
jgi:hypothetical protein